MFALRLGLQQRPLARRIFESQPMPMLQDTAAATVG
jgi:hypothetical protein